MTSAARLVAFVCLLLAAADPAAAAGLVTPRDTVPIDPPAASQAGGVALGPFEPAPVTTLYVVGDDRPGVARVTVTQKSSRTGDRVMLRAYDPDERLSHWQYAEWGQTEDQPVPAEGTVLLDKNVRIAAGGVNQIRLSCGERNVRVTVTLPRESKWGVSAQNGTFRPWPDQPREMYVYIPPRADELWGVGWTKNGVRPIRVFDDLGAEVAYPDGETAKSIAIARTEVVWKLVFDRPAEWEMAPRFFPLILCPTPEAATAIRASVETLPDGTVVAHKFQARIAALLPELLKPERVGTAADLVEKVASRRDAYAADPLRKIWLTQGGAFLPGVREALLGQNVDPTSHWSGAMVGWEPKSKLAPPLDRWDRYAAVDGLVAGFSTDHAGYEESLARAATTDDPANPYAGKKELIYRAVASSLKNMMRLNEAEVWPEVAHSPYPGFIAFGMGQKTFPPFGVLAQHLPADMPPEARDLWTEGLRRLVDRTFTDHLVDTRNQSAHFIVAYDEFARGTGDPLYAEMSEAYNRRFCTPRAGFTRTLGTSPAGYPAEAMGPDAYADMSHWHMAAAYRTSGDPRLLEALRRSYQFFNHTVAPEPDGRMIGASNFCHRTAGWIGREGSFWGGARGIVDDVAPEVGLWARVQELNLNVYSPDQYADPAALAKAKQRAMKLIEKNLEAIDSGRMKPSWPMNKAPRYEHHTDKPDLSGVWPAEEATSFVRDFGGELIAVKRPAYYATVYVGKPAATAYTNARGEFEKPDAADDTGKAQPYRRGFPMTGGGLSTFWTPGYGTAVAAMNWSPYTHHGLVALSADGTRVTWADYQSVAHRLDAAAGRLTVTGRVTGQPLEYVREYAFGDDAVTVRLTVTATAACDVRELAENVPILAGPFKRDGAATAVEPGGGYAVVNKGGRGIAVRVTGPDLKLEAGNNGRTLGDVQINRLEIALPTAWRAGDARAIQYVVSGVSR